MIKQDPFPQPINYWHNPVLPIGPRPQFEILPPSTDSSPSLKNRISKNTNYNIFLYLIACLIASGLLTSGLTLIGVLSNAVALTFLKSAGAAILLSFVILMGKDMIQENQLPENKNKPLSEKISSSFQKSSLKIAEIGTEAFLLIQKHSQQMVDLTLHNTSHLLNKIILAPFNKILLYATGGGIIVLLGKTLIKKLFTS